MENFEKIKKGACILAGLLIIFCSLGDMLLRLTIGAFGLLLIWYGMQANSYEPFSPHIWVEFVRNRRFF